MRRPSILSPYVLTVLLAISTCPPVPISTSAPDLNGQWAGAVTTGSMSGALEIVIPQDGGAWNVTMKMDMGGKQASNQTGDLKVGEIKLPAPTGPYAVGR